MANTIVGFPDDGNMVTVTLKTTKGLDISVWLEDDEIIVESNVPVSRELLFQLFPPWMLGLESDS